MSETIVLLHGFSGTRRAWDGVAAELPQSYRPMALDLPGHGDAVVAPAGDFDAYVEHVLDRAPARFDIAGYSMGGRIALRVALAAPERVTRLGLLSTTAGIEAASERRVRRAADDELASWIERHGVAAFAERWGAEPLFAGQPPEVAAAARADRLRGDAVGLAAALRAVGTGAMAPLWGRLAELAMPAVVIVGERDEKFKALGRRLAATLAAGRLVVVPGAGHAVHLEAPAVVARELTTGALRP